MGQPINVVEKPGSRPGLVRFETNRSLTGMGHERYMSPDDILDDRPMDELARRLFATGQVKAVHANGNVVTVELVDEAATRLTGVSGVIEDLYLHYPPPDGAAADEPEVQEAATTEASA